MTKKFSQFSVCWLGTETLKHFLNKKKMFLVCKACGILVPRPGIKLIPLALEVQSLNHWTTGEVPAVFADCLLLPGPMQAAAVQP